MFSKVSILLLAATVASINATQLATFVPTDISARSINSAGGWALALKAGQSVSSCPAGDPPCGGSWCCPSSLACYADGFEDIANICCPTDSDCSPGFVTTPVCANSSWTLWNATFNTEEAAGLFCCLPGQVGLQSGYCAEIDTVEATQSPQAIPLFTTTSTPQPAATVSSTASFSSAAGSSISTIAAVVQSTTLGTGTGKSISSPVATSASIVTSSEPATSLVIVTPTGTAGSTPSSTTAASVTAKGEAAGLGRISLGGAVVAMFALALL